MTVAQDATSVYPSWTAQQGRPGSSHPGRLDAIRARRHPMAVATSAPRGPSVMDPPAGSPGSEPSGQIGRLEAAPRGSRGKPPATDGREAIFARKAPWEAGTPASFIGVMSFGDL